MGMGMDFLLNAVKNSVVQHSNEQGHTGFDPGPLLGHLEEIFQQHQAGVAANTNVQPASRDPYGDPANQSRGGGNFGNVKPASQDPYGDPGDGRH